MPLEAPYGNVSDVAPKLVGLIKLDFPWVSKKSTDDVKEQIAHVAFDTDGQAWGLVQRHTVIERSAPASGRFGTATLGRIDFVRWIAFSRLPFTSDEFMDEHGWANAPELPGTAK